MHRGVLCNAFMSNRTDFFIPALGKLNYTVFEWFFMDVRDYFLKNKINLTNFTNNKLLYSAHGMPKAQTKQNASIQLQL